MKDPLAIASDRWSDSIALVDVSRRWTWSELLADANDLTRHIDVQAGERVALLTRDSGDAVVAIHAARIAGAVLVPLQRRLTLAELQPLVTRSGAIRLVHDDTHREIARDLARAVPSLLPVPLGQGRVSATPAGGRAPDEAAVGALVFTSGTTGLPRGALLTHANLLASAHAWNSFLDARQDDHWLAALPLSHVAGLGLVLRSVCSGARLTVLDRFDTDAVRAALAGSADLGISHVSLVPVQLARLLAGGPIAASRLRGLLLGGAPIPVALVERALAAGLPVVPTYGLTEAASGVTALRAGEAASRPGSAGEPLPGMRVRVVANGGSEAAPGEVGDILVAGPMVFVGYDGEPTATDLALRDGWLHTGDVGALDVQGCLTVLDRRDDLVISGGENISPVEVEDVLALHPDVGDAAVVGRPDPTWGSVPVAAVVPRPGATPDAEAIVSFARERLAGFKVPRSIEVVPAIPRTASGKIIRRELSRTMVSMAVDGWIDRPDGARIHVRRRGGGPTLVLLHATLSNAQELDPLSMALAERCTVLAIDRRSAGASSMPPDDVLGPVDVQVHIDDIVTVLDALAPGRKVLVVGHSYGGCVGLELATRCPDRVAGAWLFEPPYLSVLPDASEAGAATLGDRISGIARDAGPGAAALAFLETVNGPDVLRRLPPEAVARFEREGRGAVADSALLGFRPGELGGVTAPVIVGLGGRSRGPYGQVADGLTQRIASCTVERFPTLGHGGPISRPLLVADAIHAFAQRVGLAGSPALTLGGTP
jgi:O-succinylbenzoic acid--CoA ligase